MNPLASLRACAALALLATPGCGGSNADAVSAAADATARAAAAQNATPVRTVVVRREDAAQAVRATGLLTGKQEARLAFKIAGVIADVRVNEGDRVRRGQLLATLQQDEARSRVAQAERSFEKAERDLARAQRLHGEGVAPLDRAQDAQTALEVARAALVMTRFDRTHASIEAPADGVVLARLAEPNETVQAGTPILRFESGDRGFVVRVGLADRDIVRVRPGDRATLRSNAWMDRSLGATVSEIAAAASPATGTFDVELTLDPTDAPLLSGMHVRVAIDPAQRETVWRIPIDAFIEGDGDRGVVYRFDRASGVARRTPVTVAFLDGDSIALRAGLADDAEVVTDGAAWLRDGASVRVLTPELADAP